MATKLDRAVALTLVELRAMPTDQLQGVAQTLGTSGRNYDGRGDIIRRIQRQQLIHLNYRPS